MSDVVFTDYAPELLDAVAAIERASFTDPWSKNAFTALGADANTVFIAGIADGKTVSYAIGDAAADEGEVLNIAVAREYRKAGIGRRTLRELLGRLRRRGAERVYLEVRGSNTAALSLYRSEGFTSVAVRKRYYRYPVEDAVVMALKFDS